MNSFGRLFKVQIFGESHGFAVGVTIDGVPAGISISESDFELDLSRRMPKIKGTTSRRDILLPKIVSGVYMGKTTASPLMLVFNNTDTKSEDYSQISSLARPGHSDFVAHKKYFGFNNPNGGGHFSGRLTTGIVAAGVIAKIILEKTKIEANLTSVHSNHDINKEIDIAIEKKDSVGGVVECIVSNMDIGIGEPFFDSIESYLSHIIFAIPGIKGIEFGSGFGAANMYGSEHNDEILDATGKTKTNHSGGINGGISNGNDIVFRVAIKPTSSISQVQTTINLETGKKQKIEINGRHDACIALRMPVIVEAATAIALADLYLIRQSQLNVR